MKVLGNLIEVQQMVVYPAISDLFQSIVEADNRNDIDLGDFAEQFEQIAEKIEEGVAAQEEPVELSEEDQNFVFGLALILGIR